MNVRIIYPENRLVSESWVCRQYADMVATDFMKQHPTIDFFNEPAEAQRLDLVWNDALKEGFEVAKAALEDAGLVTFAS